MQSNLGTVFDRIFLSEGGWAQKPTEPGGAVNRGISFLVYQGWRAMHHEPAPTLDDLKNMSRDEAEQIYEVKFFAPCRFDQLQNGVDYAVVDYAVNSGVAAALTNIREALGFKQTDETKLRPWRMENDLLYALKNRPIEPMIDAICDRRWENMKGRPDFALKAKGRAKRMNACYSGSRELAGLPVIPPRYAS